jgi:hypothetical protein
MEADLDCFLHSSLILSASMMPFMDIIHYRSWMLLVAGLIVDRYLIFEENMKPSYIKQRMIATISDLVS